MKLFGFLRKPEWEQADPKRRLAAVESAQDPALKALLPELAQTDPDPTVRIAALGRVDDLGLLERRMRGEHLGNVANAAKQRLMQKLCVKEVELGSAQEALRQVHDEDVLSQVAEHAQHVALRRLALERSQRPGLKLQRCLNDSDHELRLWLLQQIDDPDALERIADNARKKDKRLARAARDKLEAQRIAAGDPAALSARALLMAEQAGRLARELPEQRDQQFRGLQQDWTALRERLDPAVQRRVDGAMEMADLALRAARGEWSPAPQRDATAADSDAGDAPDSALQQQLSELKAQIPAAGQADFVQQREAVIAQLQALQAQLSQARDAEVEAEQARLQQALEQSRREHEQQLREAEKALRQAERQAEREAQAAAAEQQAPPGRAAAAAEAALAGLSGRD